MSIKKIHGDRLLIQKVSEEVKKSTIIQITEEEKPIAVGLILKIGKAVLENEEGDRIMYDKQHAMPINIDGEDLFILREYDVIVTI